jgi:hypothetical protein
MHFRDFSSTTSSTYPTLDHHGAARFIIEQQFATNRPTTEMPHLVDCPELVPQRFKTPAEFHRAVALRKGWCSRYAYGGYAAEALGDDADQHGLRFRFKIGPVATLFNLMHGACGTRSSNGRA